MPRLQTLIQRVVAPLTRQVRGMVLRGVVKVVNDSLKCQGLQVALTSDRLSDDKERFEDYGLTSHPFTDAEVLYLSVGGNPAHGVVVRVNDRRHRPTDMAEGDVCLYTDKGERVYLDRAADVVRIGDKAAAEFLILGTLFRTKQAVLNSALQTGWTALSTAWTAMGVGWTAVGTFGTAVSGDSTMSVHPITQGAAGTLATAAGVAATACTAAASACTTASSAISTFESSGGASDYKSTKAATIA